MVPDRQKVWMDRRTDGMDGRTDHTKNYIPPTSLGITIALVIGKLKYLTFDPLGGVKGGGVKF